MLASHSLEKKLRNPHDATTRVAAFSHNMGWLSSVEAKVEDKLMRKAMLQREVECASSLARTVGVYPAH